MCKLYGDTYRIIPRVEEITCPNCCTREKMYWLDEETEKKMALKKLGLDNGDTLMKKVETLEKQFYFRKGK
jgi:hypothetical protein